MSGSDQAIMQDRDAPASNQRLQYDTIPGFLVALTPLGLGRPRPGGMGEVNLTECLALGRKETRKILSPSLASDPSPPLYIIAL